MITYYLHKAKVFIIGYLSSIITNLNQLDQNTKNSNINHKVQILDITQESHSIVIQPKRIQILQKLHSVITIVFHYSEDRQREVGLLIQPTRRHSRENRDSLYIEVICFSDELTTLKNKLFTITFIQSLLHSCLQTLLFHKLLQLLLPIPLLIFSI